MTRKAKVKNRRVNILIPDALYHEIVVKRKWKLSGTIREALDDVVSQEKIIFSVSPETKDLYHQIFSNSDCLDSDLEPYLRIALGQYLEQVINSKVGALSDLREKLAKG